MTKGTRILLILLALGLAALSLLPTIKWYFYTSEEKQNLANSSMTKIREYAEESASRDLDILVDLSRDDQKVQGPVPEELTYLLDTAKENRKLVEKDIPKEWTVKDLLSSFSDGSRVYKAMESYYREEILALKELKQHSINLGLDLYGGISVVIEADENSLADRLIADNQLEEGQSPSKEQLAEALTLATEILNNRIDQFGVTEPQIRKMTSENQILIEVPGEVNPDTIHNFLMGKGRLGFYIVDDAATSAVLNYVDGGGRIVNGRPADDPDMIDVGLTVRGFYKKDAYNKDVFQRYVVTTSSAGLDGGHIESAQVETNQVTGDPYVVFALDADGGDLFYALTSENTNKTMAVVMDGKVKAAAVISGPIRDRVQITGFDRSDADALALVLKTAAMPIDLSVKSQNTVGASLGADTIDAGLKAIGIGLAAVMIFMALWYRRAGLIANLALLLNFVFIVAILSALRLTLTMTSIAGIILNVGMAVDANVIIFERIKEELRLGKSRAAAIEGGFRKAFWTIMDANITTFIAALFLSMLGSGPVQGFALTLAVGIMSSLFTAIYVSHYLFDVGTEMLKQTKVRIGWGK